MRDLDPGLALKPPRCTATGVERERLRARSQESYAMTVSDPDKDVEIHGESLGRHKRAINTPVSVP